MKDFELFVSTITIDALQQQAHPIRRQSVADAAQQILNDNQTDSELTSFTAIDGQTLPLTPLEQFLALRGTLRDDPAFDQAMDYLDQAWQSWTTPSSV